MAQRLLELFKTVPPRRVVVLGKGPSLDRYDPSEFEGDVIVALNEAAQSFPCHYAFFADKHQVALDLPEHVMPVRRARYEKSHDGRGYVFERDREIPRRYAKHTAAIAMSTLGQWGVREVLLVGFDGFDFAEGPAYANTLTGLFHDREDADYARINVRLRAALAEYDIKPRFFHRGESFGDPIESPQESFIVVSFYTKNTPYEDEIANLQASLERLRIGYKFYERESRGKWTWNTWQKCGVLREALDEHLGHDVIFWLDADAILHRRPELCTHFNADFGAHWHRGVELNNAAMILKNNGRMRLLLDLWQKELNKANDKHHDQRIMQITIEKYGESIGLRTVKLPPEYCKIFDYRGTIDVEPIVEQFQASRRFKRAVEGVTSG